MTPFIRAKLDRRPSVSDDARPFASRGQGSSWPTTGSPGSIIGSNSQSRPPAPYISSNATPGQANSPEKIYHHPSPTSHAQLSPTKPNLVLPSPSVSPDVPSADASPMTSDTGVTGLDNNRSCTHTSVAPVGKPPQAPATWIPRTLREFEEAYAPTYMRIERFLQDVENNKYARVGLTPEMLKQIKP